MAKKVLIVRGGWEGHEPVQVSEVFQSMLEKEGFEVEISETLDSFLDLEKIKALHIIVPIWTGGTMTGEQVKNISKAVAEGTAIAGCHGGMCDAFRDNVEWQFITGGNWVSHPGGDGVEYVVNIKKASSSAIVAGVEDFTVKSEQYYLHVDPAVDVLATTRVPVANWYHAANGTVDMPAMWTKMWGLGRIFYSSVGHHADVFDIPQAYETMRRGFLWAAEGKDIVMQKGLTPARYESDQKMF